MDLITFKLAITLSLCLLFAVGTGTGMNHRVVVKCVWCCITIPLYHLMRKVISCSSGMMTTAVPRTTLSANTRKVSRRCCLFPFCCAGNYFLLLVKWQKEKSNFRVQRPRLKCDHCCQQLELKARCTVWILVAQITAVFCPLASNDLYAGV